MVLLAAAVCNRTGKAIISRQFVEMTRARIEGLLAAFPKLMSGGKQHTFVETESVRYVYQPLEKLYMLLITTKASNILEDLETLRLFAKVIPEYCRNMDESEIIDQAFSLIFAFDEIVALGYRENVNIAQIRTFTEMDSHEERVFMAVRQTQEKEARDHMLKKAEELRKMKTKGGTGSSAWSPGFGGGGGGSNNSVGRLDTPVIDTTHNEPVKPYTTISKPSGLSKAMKLGSKTKDVDTFVDQLKSEGEHVTSPMSAPSTVSKMSTSALNQEGVHLRVEEKIVVQAGRDGGLQNLEVFGLVKLKVSDEKYGKIKVGILNNDNKGVQIQTHPNIDKKLFNASSYIALKNPEKPFPLHQEIGVLKWRFQTLDESYIPLSINCWPSDAGANCDVNIEYELEQPTLELNDVVITIPMPTSHVGPIVTDCDGEYTYDRSKNHMIWSLPVIDASNKCGSLEFSIPGHPEDFFPVSVSFVSVKSYCDIQVTEVLTTADVPVKYSSEVFFYVDKYEIV